MLGKIKELFYDLPLRVDMWLRRWDLKLHRTDCTKHHDAGFVTMYSPLALWLPIPVIIVLAYGLPRWRGWLLFLAALVAIVDHLLICWLARGRRLPQAQWGLLTFLALALFTAGLYTGGTQAGAGVYPHLFALFGVVMLSLGMPFSRAWADWLIGRERQRFRDQFADRLQETQLFVNYDPPRHEPIRVVRSYLLVPFSSLLMLAIVPAIFVLLSHPSRVHFWAVTSLVLWWAFLAFGHYQERLKASHTIVRQMFLVGGATVVSLIVILFAVTRLLGVSYVTTVLDQTTRWTVATSIAILYLIIWLYDYWLQRARAEVLLGFLTHEDDHPCCLDYRDAHLQIHGAGRFLVVREDPARGFEPYAPLEVFEKIVEQLEGRVRTEEIEFRKIENPDPSKREAMKRRWRQVDAAADALDALVEKSRLYTVVPAVLVGLLLAIGVPRIFTQDQRPSLEVPTSAAGPLAFDFDRDARAAAGDDTVYALAASGGGTRAALYSYAVLRALHDRRALGQLTLVSSVSGGSAGTAYFAAHRARLLEPDAEAEWNEFREALAGDHIRRVLAGALEWRFVTGERVGRLLTESFDDDFFSAGDGGCRTLQCAQVGVIFNTAVTGSWRASEAHSARCLEERGKFLHCATVERAGSRLVITNVAAMTAESVATALPDWPLDFNYEVIHDPGAPLTTAASLSANFPPVFSNAAVHLDRGTPDERRYWVTDGGAVENRGLLSALLALRAQARRWVPAGALDPPADCPAGSAGRPAGSGAAASLPEPPPPSVKILVADASGFSRPYKEDRGIGAAGAAASRLANKLIAELTLEVQAAWRVASRCRSTVEIVHLPMPEVFRSGFSTHWQMPKGVELRDPAEWYRQDNKWYQIFRSGPRRVVLDEAELKDAVDLIFAPDERRDAWSSDDGDRAEVVKWMTGDGRDDVREVLDRALG